MRAKVPWLAVHTELSSRKRTFLGVGAFLLPLVFWAVVSYTPFIWHPYTLVTDSGDTALDVGTRAEHEYFNNVNAEAITQGKRPATGKPANPVFLPAPHEVAISLVTGFTQAPRRGDPWLHEQLSNSIQVIFWGFFYSCVFGIPLGVLCGTFNLFERLNEPFIDFVRYMPAPAFSGLMVAILGTADAPKVAIIFIGTFFQMVLVLANTTRDVDRPLIEAAQTLGAKRFTLVSKVIIPGIMPRLYVDLRILLGWAWTYLIIAELIGAKSGISAYIQQQGRYFHYDNVFAGIILIGIIGFTTDRILGFIELFLFPWEGKEPSRFSRSVWNVLAFVPRRIMAFIEQKEMNILLAAEEAFAASASPYYGRSVAPSIVEDQEETDARPR